MSEPSVPFTPAGGSPPRPTPKRGDTVEVTVLPAQRDDRLKLGQRGVVQYLVGAMLVVRFHWGEERLNPTQIRLLTD